MSTSMEMVPVYVTPEMIKGKAFCAELAASAFRASETRV